MKYNGLGYIIVEAGFSSLIILRSNLIDPRSGCRNERTHASRLSFNTPPVSLPLDLQVGDNVEVFFLAK
jgi:hypothetical protein